MLESLTVSDFEGRVGERFTVDAAGVDGPTVDMELVEVTVLGAAARPEGRTPFSLVLRGPVGNVLPQRIYPVDHVELGTLEIFVVPIGPDSAGMRYEAIFT